MVADLGVLNMCRRLTLKVAEGYRESVTNKLGCCFEPGLPDPDHERRCRTGRRILFQRELEK